MTQTRHLFLTGSPGVGKSTLLQRLLAAQTRPSVGFYTKKRTELDGTSLVELFSACSGDLRRACCARRLPGGVWQTEPESFDTLGAVLLTDAPKDCVIVMDELGRLESSAPRFCQAVLQLLNGETPVLGVVKPRADTELLIAVHCHPRVDICEVTAENRDTLFEKIGRKYPIFAK